MTKKSHTLTISLLFFTAIGISLYWLFVFVDLFPVTELIPGYTHWFMSFPLADMYIAFSALLAGYFFIRRKKQADVF